MSTPRLDPVELRRLLDAGCSQTEAARRLGVSPSAVSQRVRSFRQYEARHPSMEIVGFGATVIDGEVSAPDRLAWIQRAIDRELEGLLDESRKPEANRKDLRNAIVKLSAEARQLLALQVSLLKAVADLRAVRAFRQTVFEAIAAEAPEVIRSILARLQEHRTQRGTMGLSALVELIEQLEEVVPAPAAKRGFDPADFQRESEIIDAEPDVIEEPEEGSEPEAPPSTIATAPVVRLTPPARRRDPSAPWDYSGQTDSDDTED